jgi:hypothetical protein
MSLSNRSHAIRSAMSAVDEMDAERKELSAQHRARKKLIVIELGLSLDAFDAMRKLSKLESDDAADVIRDAYSLIAPGQTVDWISAMGEPEQPMETITSSSSPPEEFVSEYSAPPRRRGRPPGSKNKPRTTEAPTDPLVPATDDEIILAAAGAHHAEAADDDLDDFVPR